MRTIRTKVYKFDELSKSAKQTAIEELRPRENFWDRENKKSLEEFCNIFPCKISRNGLVFTGDDNQVLSGQRLATYIWNNYRDKIYKPKQYWICDGRQNTVGANSKHRNSNIFLDELGCVLSGFYIDNYILAPLFDFMRKPDNRNFENLIDDCFIAWEKAREQDWEFQNSDEQIIETIKANDYEFFANGKLI